MSVLLACMVIYCVHAWGPLRRAEGVGAPETGVTDSDELPCGAGIQPGSSIRAVSALEP